MRKGFSLKGFTLIELLIVVAIIGILAAIAVPNFLNAQVRAKLARNMSDMKSILTSIEMLRLDTGYLPQDGWDDDTEEGRRILKEVFNGVGDFPEANRKTSHYLAVLTSPISYMSSVPTDPFLSKLTEETARGFGSPHDSYIYFDVDPHVLAKHGTMNQGIQALNSPMAEQFGFKPFRPGDYGVMGVGPDGFAGTANSGAAPNRGIPYEGSNGLNSIGDIFGRSGGGFNN